MSKKIIGVITNNQHSVFQSRNILGIRDIAEARGYQVVIDSYAEDPQRPHSISLQPERVDGIIVIANAAPRSYLEMARKQGVPVSLVSHQAPELSVPVIVSNNAQGIAELVKHVVVRCQRKQLVYVRGIDEQTDAAQRETAFRQELMRYDLEIPESHFIRGEFSPDTAAESMRALIGTGAKFDAVIAADYRMAMAIVDLLRGMGVRVPEDVCVVGFGDAPEAEAAGLTTVAADIRQLARHAAKQLISQIEGLAIRGVTRLSVELVVRQTCGCRSEK